MLEQANHIEKSNFEMVLHSATKLPDIKINRAIFLRKKLSKYFDGDEIIEIDFSDIVVEDINEIDK